MTQTINENNIRDSLRRVIESDTFAHSQAFQDLLVYLVEASLQNNPPKEFAIATEVFHKGQDFDPSHDTIVRVYVYNLRKKLEHYYQHEGKEEKIRFEIPKGHYGVEFVRKEQTAKKKSVRLSWLIAPFVVLLLSNLYLSRFVLHKAESNFQAAVDSVIWSDFFGNGVPKQLVLGDHFFFVRDSHDREKRTILRRDDINSNQEFQQYKSKNIERRNYVQLRYPMFPKNSVWPMADLVTLLSCADLDFSMEYSSNVKASDFKDKDMLFVGSFHTLGALEQTFRNSHFDYKVYPNGLSYRDETMDTIITRQETGDPVFNHMDYAIVRKIPGPEQKTIFMFTSFHETGTHGTVKYFTEPETLQELENHFTQKFGYIPDYFEILFQASGYNRTVYTTKIEQIFEIPDDSIFW